MTVHDAAGPVERARLQNLSDIPRRSAARHPQKTAVVHRDVRITFTEFDGLVDQVAAAIHASGLRQGDTLALLSHNCWQFPVLSFAAARIGVIFVPINFMLTPDEVSYILRDSDADAFIVEDALVPVAEQALADHEVRVRAAVPLTGQALRPGWSSFAEWTQGDYGAAPDIAVADDDVIRIMYTSGTESRPKGALLTSRSLMWQYMSCIVTGGMDSDDIEVHAMPLYHCAQLDNFLSTDLYLGATSIILDRPDPGEILRAIERENATNFFAPPTIWISLMRESAFETAEIRSLRKGYYGASALPVEVLQAMTRRLPDIQLWNFYGQTEMASLATALGPQDQERRGGSAGRPALNVETRIVDDHDRSVPAGQVGEIVHRSPHATVGYQNNLQKTAETFRGNWFHSGDLGYFDAEGFLWIVDRKKDMIKTGGENVATREVEEALYSIDGVAEAAVIGVPHPRWIEAVAGVVVPRIGTVLDERDMIDRCRRILASFKVPKYITFVEELPKNPSGKILKKELREQLASLVDTYERDSSNI